MFFHQILASLLHFPLEPFHSLHAYNDVNGRQPRCIQTPSSNVRHRRQNLAELEMKQMLQHYFQAKSSLIRRLRVKKPEICMNPLFSTRIGGCSHIDHVAPQGWSFTFFALLQSPGNLRWIVQYFCISGEVDSVIEDPRRCRRTRGVMAGFLYTLSL